MKSIILDNNLKIFKTNEYDSKPKKYLPFSDKYINLLYNKPVLELSKSAYQNLTANTWTAISFNTFLSKNKTSETWFDGINKFTPNYPGWYKININSWFFQRDCASTSGTDYVHGLITIKKNNTDYQLYNAWKGNQNATNRMYIHQGLSGLVYCDGNSDYIQMYAYGTARNNAVSINAKISIELVKLDLPILSN